MDWKLCNLPCFDGGEIQPLAYRCGSGIADDFDNVETSEDSTMQIVTNTTDEAFLKYCATLSENGFEEIYRRDEKHGIYRQFKKGDKLFYLYFTFAEKTAHIIEDNASVTLDVFSEDDAPDAQDSTDLMQFGLFYDEMIHGTSCDCGMNYVIRLRNNKLIIVDGGEWEQTTKPSVDEFLKRVRSMTGTKDGDPIEVALWYCTHMHDDHMDFFIKLVKKYGDMVKIDRVMFNFPAYSVYEYKDYVQDMRKTLSAHSPALRFLKPHTGQKFKIDGAEIDVIYTHEDLFEGTEESVDYSANTFSTVIQVSFEGVTLLLLADADDRVGEILCRRYETLPCTFMQAPHHGINRVEHIYALVDSEYVLLPESSYHMHKSERMRGNLSVIYKYNNPLNVLLAGDYTVVFRAKDGELESECFPIRGCLYDGN